jgi:hypothetical protein
MSCRSKLRLRFEGSYLSNLQSKNPVARIQNTEEKEENIYFELLTTDYRLLTTDYSILSLCSMFAMRYALCALRSAPLFNPQSPLLPLLPRN